MTRKKLGVTLLILFTICISIFSLSGCGKQNLSDESDRPTMTIDINNGQKTRNGTAQEFYQVEDGKKGELKFNIEKEDGQLDISVFNTATNEKAYSGTNIPSSIFSVELNTPGEYKVLYKCDNFVGNYGTEWSQK